MRRKALVALVAAAPLLAVAGISSPAEAFGWGRGYGYGYGSGCGYGYAPYYYYRPTYGYSYAPYYAYWPTVVVDQPSVYIERQPIAPPTEQFWYFCQPAGAYYPNARTCAEPWIEVTPRAQ